MAILDLRAEFGSVRDQRGLNNCVAIALADLLGFAMRRRHPPFAAHPPFEPSSLFIHYHARCRSGLHNHNVGVPPGDAMAAIAQAGICPDALFPDAGADFRIVPPAEAKAFAAAFVKPRFAAARQKLPELLALLEAGRPVFACLSLSRPLRQSFRNGSIAATGVFGTGKMEGEAIENHAVLIVGFDPARDCFILRNSLGGNWGDAGHAYAPASVMLAPATAYAFWCLAADQS